MGRQIMADIVRGDERREFVTRPDAEGLTMKIPEPYSDNVGSTGFFAVADYVRSRQEMRVGVNKSGGYASYTTYFGAGFRINLDYLRDESGNDIVDSVSSWQGAETSFAPHFLQCLTLNQTASTWGQGKMIELTRWGDADSEFGYLGLMALGKRVTGTGVGSLLIYRMEERGPHATEVGYQWEAVTHDIPDAAVAAAPSADMVEMDDGSIVLATDLVTNLRGNGIDIWRSFDGGDSWEIVDDQSTVSATPCQIGLHRIGSRLVLILGINSGGTHDVDVHYSDDMGRSWSAADNIHTDAVNQPANPFVDVATGQNGVTYVAYTRNNGANDEVLVQYTADGVNWTGPYDPNFTNTCATILQQYFGRWLIYGVVGGALHRRQREGADLYSNWLTTDKDVAQDANDTDGMNMIGICARTFANENFIDIVVTFYDTHAGTNSYGVTVYRLSMWSTYKFVPNELNAYPRVFYSCWSAYCYPSTNDGHPNLNHWTRTLGGTGASALTSADYGYLRLTSLDGVSSASYNQALAANSFDSGFFSQFKLKVVSGYAHITVNMCSAPSNEDCLFSVVFRQSNNTITLYDHRATAIVTTYTPTNWSLDDWNEYVLYAIDIGDADNLQVGLAGAPFEYYKEIAYYESVFVDVVIGDAYAADNDNFLWGIDANNPGGNGASDCYWKQVHLNTDFLETVAAEQAGRRCHTNPVGIMEGIAAKWDGDFAVEDDDWDLDVGAHYDADNIFVDSPRIRWADPVSAAARAADVDFVWRRSDHNDNCMNMAFDSIAFFGLNCPFFTLYGQNFAGGGEVELLDIDLDGDCLGPTIYQEYMVVATGHPDQQVIEYTAGTSNLDTWPTQSSFASNDYRRWYVIFTTGTKALSVYKILDNYDDLLQLECNVEALGVADGDRFVIFSDRFFYHLPQLYHYPRVKLTCKLNGLTPSPSEEQFNLGTVVLGVVYDLPDDEWESSYRTEPSVNMLEGRGGMRQWREEGPERRIIDVTYTGNRDRGMGSQIARELYRSQRWGVHPVVWIDDDFALDYTPGGGAPYHCHTDPILAKVGGPITQRRTCYSSETWDGVPRIRNVMDIGGVSLEEVL